MQEMFPTKPEVTPDEFEEAWPKLSAALLELYRSAIRGAANKARAEALDEAIAVTMTSPFASAGAVSARIHTLERKSRY